MNLAPVLGLVHPLSGPPRGPPPGTTGPSVPSPPGPYAPGPLIPPNGPPSYHGLSVLSPPGPPISPSGLSTPTGFPTPSPGPPVGVSTGSKPFLHGIDWLEHRIDPTKLEDHVVVSTYTIQPWIILSILMKLLEICKCPYPPSTKLISLNVPSIDPMFNLLVFRLNNVPVSSVHM